MTNSVSVLDLKPRSSPGSRTHLAGRGRRGIDGTGVAVTNRLTSAGRRREHPLPDLGERDCSVQRRGFIQKLLRKPLRLDRAVPLAEVRERMLAAATRAGEAVGYRNAGTVEFLVDLERPGEFYFLEMNTRLQVEHPITELVTGVDLVEQQFLIAAGQPVSFGSGQLRPTGHAIELRTTLRIQCGFFPAQEPYPVA